MSSYYVQAAGNAGAGSALDLVFADTSPGDSIVVFVGFLDTPQPTITVIDSQGNTVTPLASSNPSAGVQGTNNGYGFLFLIENLLGGPDTVHIAASHAGQMQAVAVEYLGAWIPDGSGAGEFQNTGSGPFGSGSTVTPSQDNDLLVGLAFVCKDPANSFTWNASWGPETFQSFGSAGSLEAFDQDLGAGTSGTPFYLQISTTNAVNSPSGNGFELAIAALKKNAAIVPTGDVVTDICERAGLLSSEIDVSLLTAGNLPTAGNVVEGYAITHPTAAAEILKILMDAYFFDACETGGKIKFVPRGLASAITITEDQLGLVQDKAKLIEQIAQEWDLPREVTVLYNDPALDYQQGKQHKLRNIRVLNSRQRQILTIPLTFDASIARQIAEVALYLQWLERTSYSLNLWNALYSLLDPTDVISFVYEGNTFVMRIVEDTVGGGLAIAISGKNENQSNFDSAAVGGGNLGGGGSGGGGGGGGTVGPTTVFLFDIPLLRDVDSNPQNTGFYFAFASAVAGWSGGELYQSFDNVAYNPVDSDTLNTTYGYATTTLGAPPRGPWTWDRVNTITVRPTIGAFASATPLQVLNGANALIVGGELIQFATAVNNGDGTYTLSMLLRGRRGTDPAIATHGANELVIMPSTGFLRVPEALSSVLNILAYYKGVTNGGTIPGTTAQNFTITGNDLKPYTVWKVVGSRDISSNLTLTWIRRTRVGWASLAQDPVPLSEDFESYSIDILNGSTVVRTLTASSPAVIYTAADQTTDFGSPQSSVSAKIYQISAQVGRGFPRAATV